MELAITLTSEQMKQVVGDYEAPRFNRQQEQGRRSQVLERRSARAEGAVSVEQQLKPSGKVVLTRGDSDKVPAAI